MKIVKKYEGKKVLVLGLAKSGFNAAKLLKKLGAYVTVNDKQNFDDSVDAQKLLSEGIKELGHQGFQRSYHLWTVRFWHPTLGFEPPKTSITYQMDSRPSYPGSINPTALN